MIAGIRGYLYGAIALVLAVLGVALWIQTSRLGTAQAERTLAESERDAVRADLAVSKRNADLMMAEKQEAIEALTTNAINDAVLSSRLTDTLAGINNATDASACASSPPVRAVFDSLRRQQGDNGR